MTDLVDRYLAAVRRGLLLSRGQRDDIVRELSDNLAAQIDDRTTALGRPMTETEVAALLQGYGHPLAMVARYRAVGKGRHLTIGVELIGSALFPWYEAAIAIAVGAAIALTVLAALLLGQPLHLQGLIAPVALQLGVQTALFVALHRWLAPALRGPWDARRLPGLRDPRQVPRLGSVIELALIAAFVPFWLLWIGGPALPPSASGGSLWHAVRTEATMAIALLLAVNFGIAAINLVAGRWSRTRLVGRAVANLLLGAFLLGPLVVHGISSDWRDAADGVGTTQATALADLALGGSLALAGVVCAVIGLVEVWRAVRWDGERIGAARFTAVVGGIVVMTLAVPRAASAQTAPVTILTDSAINEYLRDRVDLQHASVGMIVGITTPGGHRIISYGRRDQGDPHPIDATTLFEIGSFTKVFTALLLADMVERHQVTLDDSLGAHLPSNTRIPERAGRKITLLDLATHTSGLPFAPADLVVTDPNAYAHYQDAQLFRFLASASLAHDVGTTWEYSNLGYGLLARALAQRAGQPYEALVRERIAGPLGMTSTVSALTPALRTRLAVGHDSALRMSAPWLSPAFPGVGEMKSSTGDLLTFLDAFLGRRQTALSAAMTAMLQTRRPGPGFEQALGWWVIRMSPQDSGIALFGGETWGYHSVVAFDSRAGVGVVVLSNGSQDDGNLAAHLLRPDIPLVTTAALQARAAPADVVVDTATLNAYAGRYLPADGGPITIAREGAALIFRSSSAPQGLRLRARSARVFSFPDADLLVTFDVTAGAVTGLTVRFAGTDYPASREARP